MVSSGPPFTVSVTGTATVRLAASLLETQMFALYVPLLRPVESNVTVASDEPPAGVVPLVGETDSHGTCSGEAQPPAATAIENASSSSPFWPITPRSTKAVGLARSSEYISPPYFV